MQYKNIHFIGIGGVSLSSLALFCKSQGATVSGSDLAKSAITKSLKKQGIKVFYSHKKSHIKGADCVVFTDAVASDNEELVFARKRKIKIFKRAEFLFYISKMFKTTIAVAGCHGKTTTTGMLHFTLEEKKPTTHIGGVVNGKTFLSGEDNIFISEACEFKKNLLYLKPDIAVILNIDKDHMDCYKNLKDVKNTFQQFASQIKPNGVLVINGDDVNCKNISFSKTITFGFKKTNDFYAKNISENLSSASFDLYAFGQKIDRIKINVGLKHNVLNALATLAVCSLLNAQNYKNNLQNFHGVDRRNQLIKSGRFKVYHDYAHHPKEIKKIIAEHKKFCKGRLMVVFEAHTFSRTKALLPEFKKCFSLADEVFILPIYPAREKPLEGVSGKILASEIGAEFVSSFSKCKKRLLKKVKNGDEILVLGAGNVFKLAHKF